MSWAHNVDVTYSSKAAFRIAGAVEAMRTI